MYNDDLEMAFVFVFVAALLGGLIWLGITLTGSQCVAIEPDGDRETISCPAGWQENEERRVQEDEYDIDE